MNFTQIHERLRQELLRRIQRGTVSVSLLARQTGFGQSHLSNFLHKRRHLSLAALDSILDAQHLSFTDLLPASQLPSPAPDALETSNIPVVAHETALFDRFIRRSAVQFVLHVPQGSLSELKTRAPAARRAWQRFVGFRVHATEALAMHPLLLPGALAVVDRHSISLRTYGTGRPFLFAVRNGAHVAVRYAEIRAGKLLLRPYNPAFPVELLDADTDTALSSLVVGRVALILNET